MPYRPAHYESVDKRFQHVHSRPDQDPMSAYGPGWTALNGMQLQPGVQPSEPDRDLAEHPGTRDLIAKYTTV
jgi:hypothetical protein